MFRSRIASSRESSSRFEAATFLEWGIMSFEPDIRRRLPAVDIVLRDPVLVAPRELYGRDLVTVQIRMELDSLRARISAGDLDEESFAIAVAQLPQQVASGLAQEFGLPLHRVINATGIFLHTNLGRSPLPYQVATRIAGFLDAYCDLEYQLTSGRRGDRNVRVDRLLQAATGAEGGILVNNNASALILILSALASGKEVIVSRGELVEIGGSFRIPDILTAAGVELVEVGTTNRTRTEDYERAITDRTGMLLKVYPSNYRQIGFTSSVEPAALVELGQRRGVPVVVDEGSGLLRPNPAPQLRDHPSLSELMELGCELACGSGDKLLGGPQAGLIVGRRDVVDRCHRSPLYRALRPDRFTFAGVEEVLRMHLAGSPMPVSRMCQCKNGNCAARYFALPLVAEYENQMGRTFLAPVSPTARRSPMDAAADLRELHSIVPALLRTAATVRHPSSLRHDKTPVPANRRACTGTSDWRHESFEARFQVAVVG